MNIHYGCGLTAPNEWVNFDSSPTAMLQRLPVFGVLFRGPRFPAFPRSVRYGNIVKGLPIEDASADLVYCSHVLEHLALEDFKIALKNTYRILKPGGTFRLVLPDLERYIHDYLNSDAVDRSGIFMTNTMLGRKIPKKSLGVILRSWLGGAEHLWMWDYLGIAHELKLVGFAEVRRAEFGDSGISAFDAVENNGRWALNLGAQCRKPQ